LQLRKDFQPVILPQLAHNPGSLPEASWLTRFHHCFYVLIVPEIMPQPWGVVNHEMIADIKGFLRPGNYHGITFAKEA
jgi:hypothetical protein